MLNSENLNEQIRKLELQMQEQTIALGRTQGALAALRGVLAELQNDSESESEPE